MATTQLYLIRHGETVWNAEGRIQGWADSELNDFGLAQAQARSAAVIDLKCDAAYSSTSVRTRQTIHALLDGNTAAVRYRDELREIGLGPWEGCRRADIKMDQPEQYRYFFEQPERFNVEGAETFTQLQTRGIAAMQNIVEQHGGQRVLVVSHGAMIKSIVLKVLGWPLTQMWQEPLIENCSCSLLEHSAERGFSVSAISDETHY